MASLSASSFLCQPRRNRENIRAQSHTHSVAIPSGISISVKSCSPGRCSRVGPVRAATELVVDDPVVRKEGKEKDRVLRVGVICGGPSAERGISLNSARSVLDHIQVSSNFHLTLVLFPFLDHIIEIKS